MIDALSDRGGHGQRLCLRYNPTMRAGLFLSIIGLISSVAGAAVPSWELQTGGGWHLTTAPTTQPIHDDTLDRAEQMMQHGQVGPAKKIVVNWIKTHKVSTIRDRAIYLLGECNFQMGNRTLSFYNFDELLDLYPDSRYFYPALQRQYDIADAYLNGYKNRFLGLPILDAHVEAAEMLYRVQQRSPGSPLAEKALLRVADYYYSTGDFDIAADAYAAYIRGYPRSPYLARVRLRQAFSALAQFRGIRFDATPIIDARQQLQDLTAAYPQLAEEENIPAIVQRIDKALARKLLDIGDYYRRTSKPSAAIYYYRYLIGSYPDYREAQIARRRIADLPRWAQDQAPPPTLHPSTQPVAEARR
jgi:outer membrane assembly lipoprotein YfiO